jgi:CheY-like chemotaxis protein
MSNMQTSGFPLAEGQRPVLLNILIVDDDEVDRLRLKKICGEAGLMVDFHEAANLQQMRRKLEEELFDLVFLDNDLGPEAGLDALKVLTTHEDQVQAIPIMLTGSASYQLAVEAMRRGCADYIVKDELTVDALVKSVASAIERRALYGQLSNARRTEVEVKRVFRRVMSSCGPELRVLLRRTQTSIRVLKAAARADPPMEEIALSEYTLLEQGCKDLTVFMDDMETVIGAGWSLSFDDAPARLQ